MNILVTGSSGFIGSFFTDRFLAQGHGVTAVDIADEYFPRDCREFFKRSTQQFDLVVHCAALVGGRATIDGRPLAVAGNMAIDYDMFEWALRTEQKRVVYFSSSAAYPVPLQAKGSGHGNLRESDIDLNAPGLPDNTYGWSKLTGERLAALAAAQGLPVHVFRPFSGYGETQSKDYPFPAFIERAKQREDPFMIWGDPSSSRDWIHVEDVFGAVMTAIDRDIRNGPINLCTGVETTFLQLASMVCQQAGIDPLVLPVEGKPQGVHRRVGDPTLLNTFFTPRVSLTEGIERALRA